MKNSLKAYTSFTRRERVGILALLGVLVLLIIVRVTMHLWVKPSIDTSRQEKLSKAWQSYKENGVKETKSDVAYTQQPFEPINLNKADITTLQNLKGIGPANAQKIIDYRRKLGTLTDMEQIRVICSMHEAEFRELKKYATLTD